MRQNDLAPATGAKPDPKRIGRGLGSGHGRTAGRGTKGQKSRSGHRARPGFEGGQNPLTKRLPELRGFTNIFRKEYTTVNISRLGLFDAETEVTPELLHEAGIIKSHKHPVKILGDGELEKPLTVRASKFTQSAKSKIEAAGGKAEVI